VNYPKWELNIFIIKATFERITVLVMSDYFSTINYKTGGFP
jgi:hypothetical protein